MLNATLVRILLATVLLLGCTEVVRGQALIALLFGKKIVSPRLSMGLELGLQESTISNIPSWRPRSSFAIGAYTDIQMGKLGGPWSASIYMLFKSSKGVNHISLDRAVTEVPAGATDELHVNRRFTYFEILPFARYEIRKALYVGFGPDLAIRTIAKEEYEGREDRNTLLYTVNAKDYFNPFDLGVAFSVQYRLRQGKGIKLSMHYAQGLINIYRNTDQRGVNCELHLGVGIPIGAGGV